MAERKKIEPDTPIEEKDPMTKLENRIFVLEQTIAKHMGYHFGGVKPK